MKKIYKYLIILVLIISIVIYIISSRYELLAKMVPHTVDNIFTSDGSQMTMSKDELEISEIIPLNTKYPLNKMYKAETEKANVFLLSYEKSNLQIGDKIKFKCWASDQLYLLFRESYPNISLEQMELETPEEAYQALQLAIWELAYRTGEAESYSELSFIDSIKEDMGAKNINSKVFNKAKDLVNFVQSYGYNENNIKNEMNLVTTLVVDSSDLETQTINIDDNDYMVGPYKYKLESGILQKIEIEITNENGEKIDGKVVDKNGFEIKDYTSQEEFYIRIPKECKHVEFTIKAEVKRMGISIYEDNDTDYIVNTYIMNYPEQKMSFNIK